MNDWVQIKITKSLSGTAFPYGILTKTNKEFITMSVGKVFPAIRNGMNYFKLPNGMLVHVYNTFELPRESWIDNVEVVADMFIQEFAVVDATNGKAIDDLITKVNVARLEQAKSTAIIFKQLREMSAQPGYEELAGLVTKRLVEDCEAFEGTT